MRVLLVVILDVLLVPVTGRKQSQLLVLGLSLEFDNYGAFPPLIHKIQLSFFFGLSYLHIATLGSNFDSESKLCSDESQSGLYNQI